MGVVVESGVVFAVRGIVDTTVGVGMGVSVDWAGWGVVSLVQPTRVAERSRASSRAEVMLLGGGG